MKTCAVLWLLEITGLAAGASSDDYYKAIRSNDLAQLKSLVSAGDVNVKDRRGATPLMYAASVGSVDAVKLLLAAGADAKVKNSFDATALMWGITNLEKVRLLVDAGVDVNAVTGRGDTALHFAAGAGNVTMVKLLLAKGADVNTATQESIPVRKGPIALNHLTALMYAAPYGTPDLVRLLIDAGAEVNAKDIRDMTPLMLAVSSETQNAEVV